MAVLPVTLTMEATLAFPCVRSERSGDFNGDGFMNMLSFANLAANWLDADLSQQVVTAIAKRKK